MIPSGPVFRQLVSRAVRTDYLDNLTGFAWLVIQPLLLLAVYAFVFTTIFKARIPAAGELGFVPFLAVAFWPWTAFSESVLRASGAVTSNAALIGKVAFPAELLPLSTVAATFLMHLAGYLAVLIVLQLLGTTIHWLGLLAALPVLFCIRSNTKTESSIYIGHRRNSPCRNNQNSLLHAGFPELSPFLIFQMN